MPANDTTGWILACASGVACIVGSSLIFLDLVCQKIPRWKHFSIRESTTFLSASLSLSFGVMIFSALYGMLPKAHEYLLEGLSPGAAAYALVGSFLAGVGGLQIVSELLHHFLPSSIVNCDGHVGKKGEESAVHSHSHPNTQHHSHPHARPNHSHVAERSHEDLMENGQVDHRYHHHHHHHHHYHNHGSATEATPLISPQNLHPPRRPSIKQKLSGTVNAVSTLVTKRCNADGTCYGFSDHVCEQKCDPVKILELLHEMPESEELAVTTEEANEGGTRDTNANHRSPNGISSYAPNGHAQSGQRRHTRTTTGTDGHHHVAKNKFLSIGVQTSIAISLHKIPEGFITYATNHANPQLGFAVFLAIFIHNIAEGFVMSLPLFLALKSRLWAIVWASLLGGLSQPLGAGIAALMMRGGNGVGGGVMGYGILFAANAGIMSSVGLQLYSQAVQLHHGSKIPLVFGFIGMGLLGVSFALTAR